MAIFSDKHARQAIVTKFHGPTNTLGSRISATSEAGRVTVAWNHSLNAIENHKRAAEALCDKLGWFGEYASGWLPNDGGYVFVNLD